MTAFGCSRQTRQRRRLAVERSSSVRSLEQEWENAHEGCPVCTERLPCCARLSSHRPAPQGSGARTARTADRSFAHYGRGCGGDPGRSPARPAGCSAPLERHQEPVERRCEQCRQRTAAAGSGRYRVDAASARVLDHHRLAQVLAAKRPPPSASRWRRPRVGDSIVLVPPVALGRGIGFR